MAAASATCARSRQEQHVVRTTDGQDGYNEARRCQCVAPADDTDARKENTVLEERKDPDSVFSFATSCLLSAGPNCCLAWRQRSLGVPFAPAFNYVSRRGTPLLLSLLSLVIKQLLTPSSAFGLFD